MLSCAPKNLPCRGGGGACANKWRASAAAVRAPRRPVHCAPPAPPLLSLQTTAARPRVCPTRKGPPPCAGLGRRAFPRQAHQHRHRRPRASPLSAPPRRPTFPTAPLHPRGVCRVQQRPSPAQFACPSNRQGRPVGSRSRPLSTGLPPRHDLPSCQRRQERGAAPAPTPFTQRNSPCAATHSPGQAWLGGVGTLDECRGVPGASGTRKNGTWGARWRQRAREWASWRSTVRHTLPPQSPVAAVCPACAGRRWRPPGVSVLLLRCLWLSSVSSQRC